MENNFLLDKKYLKIVIADKDRGIEFYRSLTMADTRAKLNSRIICFIIKQLAQFASLQEVVNAVKAEYAIEVSRQAIQFHNIKHKKTILVVRKRFCENILAIPIANKAYRLRELERVYKNSKEGIVKINALRAACAEIGEKFDKIADAIAKSGGDNIVTIIHNEAAQRRITEAAGVCGFTRIENSN